MGAAAPVWNDVNLQVCADDSSRIARLRQFLRKMKKKEEEKGQDDEEYEEEVLLRGPILREA